MIDLSQIQCVGCTACVSVCPTSVITMGKNEEGFQYPFILDQTNCIHCGLCKKVCPVLNVRPEKKQEQKALIAQIIDKKIRRESTSGGMFSAIALSVLSEQGIVFGAAYDKDFKVCHIGVENKEELWRLRNSKYVQSDLNGIFNQVELELKTGRRVLFSGTPCQIEGLYGFLRKDYDNLLLVDVVCHGIGSPLIWDKYLETLGEEKPKKIYFRWKHYGYKYSTMSYFDENNNEIYYAGVESDKMLRAYFTNNCDRETCYSCAFKKRYRISDFTIWDCFQPKYINKNFDDDMGTSCVLINSNKGFIQLQKIIKSELIKYQFVSADELVLGNNEMIASVKKGECRELLLKDAITMSGRDLFKKYFPDTLKSKAKKMVRKILLKIGLYNFFKYKLFIHRRNKAKREN